MALLVAACSTSIEFEAVGTSVPTPSVADEVIEPTPDAAPSAVPTTAPTPIPPPDLPDAIDLYFADVEAYWAREMPTVWGIDFVPVVRKIPYDTDDDTTIPDCEGEFAPAALYEANAFYCEPDDYIAWDEIGLFAPLFESFGDFAVGLVIAHEYAHAIQARAQEDGPTIFVELQADCLAGAWARAVDSDGANPLRVEPADLDAAIGGFLTFADPLGTPADATGAHGSAFDRLGAFADGLGGGAEACTSYLSDPPTPAFVRSLGESGGDLPLEELLPILTADLDDYLSLLGAERGVSFEPAGETNEFSNREFLPAECATTDHDLAWSCRATGAVFLDRPALEDLWDDAGDFAPAYLVAHAYTAKYVRAAGVTSDPVEWTVQADCVVGVWARAVFDQGEIQPSERTRGLLLSTGDLDEGIVGLTSVPAAGLEPGAVGSFERVSAFAAGFFDGYELCGL